MRETVYEFELRRVKREFDEPLGRKLMNSITGGDVAKALCAERGREVFAVMYLDAANHLIGYELAAVGTSSFVAIEMTTLLRGAVIAGASGICVAHNHPGGLIEPSREDDETLGRIVASCEILGIELVDAFVVTDEEAYSYRLAGRGPFES